MYKNHFFLAILWLLYCFIHSFLANDSVRFKIENLFKVTRKRYRLGYNVLALLSLVALLLYHFSISSYLLFIIPVISTVIAMIFIFGGMIIMMICIRKYFLQLSGLGNYKQLNNKPFLETGGIHRYVRHPLYLGTLIFLAGLFFLTPLLSNLIAVAIIMIYTIIGIRFEERKLIREFGDEYKQYKKNVPMLIPYLK